MATNISTIKGITPEVVAKMKERGITNTDQLLEQAGSAATRRELATFTGLSASDLLDLVNRADLARIKGIGDAFANLLEEAGVDSVKELARRRPDNLQARLAEINETRKLTNRAPTVEVVTGWIEEAKSLGTTVEE
jgi:predicted flap endonuclease-1-like 5' DNA nuclease